LLTQCPHASEHAFGLCRRRHAFHGRRCIVIAPASSGCGEPTAWPQQPESAVSQAKPALAPSTAKLCQAAIALRPTRQQAVPGAIGSGRRSKPCEHAQTTACGLSATACGRSTTSCRRYVDVLWKLSDGPRTTFTAPRAFTACASAPVRSLHRRPCVHCGVHGAPC
jgi:hypothetical protein